MDAGQTVLVLDFGSQYTQLIARRVREQHVYCRVVPATTPFEELVAERPKALILSGGPASVYEGGSPRCDERVFGLGIPTLGICYGMQLGCEVFGGTVTPAKGATCWWKPSVKDQRAMFRLYSIRTPVGKLRSSG